MVKYLLRSRFVAIHLAFGLCDSDLRKDNSDSTVEGVKTWHVLINVDLRLVS